MSAQGAVSGNQPDPAAAWPAGWPGPGVMRASLWASVGFNLLAAALFGWPESALASALGFPVAVPVIYRALTAWLIALFAGAYVWLALQPTLDRPLVCLLASGKAGVFAVAAALAAVGAIGPVMVLLAAGDLALALLWFRWLTLRVAPEPD